jgi:long-chain acyl-CoA synthetase
MILGMADGPILAIPAFLAATVARRGDEPALGIIRGGELSWRTWHDVADNAAKLAVAMRAAGVEPGDRVAHVSENRHEWVIADLAIHLAGAVHVPIHVTLGSEQIARQIADCGARLVVVSSAELLAKFRESLDTHITVWLHDEQGTGSDALLGKPAVAPGSPGKPAVAPGRSPLPSLGGRGGSAASDDLATILYTSGTTGRPRGVMLTQRNLATNAKAVADSHGGGSEQTRLCVLPLSHIYARTCDLYTWVYRGSRLVLAENRGTLLRDLQIAKPTAFSAVPYVYQRIADEVRSCGGADPARTMRAVFGGRIERLSCGGAALAPDVEAWYAECGMPILCGYGLTESSPVITATSPGQYRAGSVGRPLDGVEVRLADDGEVLARGPNVMLGYWQDETATADAVRDGWLHTGDLGELDAGGFLYIRGRKKELIVLSTGKKVAPTRVESLLTSSPLVEQAAVFGDGQPALVALIVPSEACGFARDDPQTRERFAEEVSCVLASAAQEERVHKFILLDRPFSTDRGELTAKLSLCRTAIARNFAAEIDSLIEEPLKHKEHRARAFR